MIDKNEIECFLIDIDGVVFSSNQPVDGAKETLDYLEKNKYKRLFVTNATRHSNKALVEKFSKLPVNVTIDEILNSAYATADYVVGKKNGAKCFLTGADYLDDVYRNKGLNVTRTEEKVDFVVLGFDKRINYEMMASALRMILDGADLIAMHEDKFYPSEGKLCISLGAFVKALEYSSGKKAIVIGKPNKNFFDVALAKLNSQASKAVMIGDSITGDIVGAKKAGLKTVLVKTGNFRKEDLDNSEIKPDFVIDSIKDLPKLFKK